MKNTPLTSNTFLLWKLETALTKKVGDRAFDDEGDVGDDGDGGDVSDDSKGIDQTSGWQGLPSVSPDLKLPSFLEVLRSSWSTQICHIVDNPWLPGGYESS